MKLGLLLAALFAALPLFSQQTISGRITDEEQNPIVGVLVMNMKSSVQIVSDSQGNLPLAEAKTKKFVLFTKAMIVFHFILIRRISVLF